MFCFPWAKVQPDSGELQISDEPQEYYAVHAVRQVAKANLAPGQVQLQEPEGLTGESEDDDDEEQMSSVAVGCSSIICRGVNVNWFTCELLEIESVLNAIASTDVL